jgi:hypothetical protein
MVWYKYDRDLYDLSQVAQISMRYETEIIFHFSCSGMERRFLYRTRKERDACFERMFKSLEAIE